MSALGEAETASSPFFFIWYDGCHRDEGRKTSSKLGVKWCLTFLEPRILSVSQQNAPFLQPAPTVTLHMHQCWGNPLRSLGRAENGVARDHLGTVFNIALPGLSLSPSLLCPSCHKLYRNQDAALFPMSPLALTARKSFTLKGADGTRIVNQHYFTWTRLESAHVSGRQAHSDLRRTKQSCVD